MARKKSMDRQLTDMVNAMTSEEYCRLIDIIAPLSADERAHYDAMSDDALLAELGVVS